MMNEKEYVKMLDEMYLERVRLDKIKIRILSSILILMTVLAGLTVAFNLNLVGRSLKVQMVKYVNDHLDEQLKNERGKLIESMKELDETDVSYELATNKDRKIKIMKDIDSKIQELNKIINEDKLAESRIREEYDYALNSKYKYSLSFKDIAYLIDVCEKYKFIDPHFILSVFELESNFNKNAKSKHSTASGLGQFTDSTAKIFYEKFLKKGVYTSHELALDPKINIEFTVSYFNYLLKTNNRDYRKALVLYNGNELGPLYYTTIDNNMKRNVGYGLNNLK